MSAAGLWRCVTPMQTGYRPLYHQGVRCPACTGTAWLIGRSSAECARCGAALPLAPEER